MQKGFEHLSLHGDESSLGPENLVSFPRYIVTKLKFCLNKSVMSEPIHF